MCLMAASLDGSSHKEVFCASSASNSAPATLRWPPEVRKNSNAFERPRFCHRFFFLIVFQWIVITVAIHYRFSTVKSIYVLINNTYVYILYMYGENTNYKNIYMFDDIKTWLNNTGVLFHWAGSLRQSSSLTEVRWVVQWLHCWCHQSPPSGAPSQGHDPVWI